MCPMPPARMNLDLTVEPHPPLSKAARKRLSKRNSDIYTSIVEDLLPASSETI
ncbi:hypothetical protein BDV41DRAFT_541085 [Aspergillus transmontanensis]|uniref:Uncharacterized protein n=1 Tax=Aspergillus transmontanensis TaxID=1034304 RepID=A0A5N6VXA9_9EURO|nr:hypothetical protein BDV41DRAFT_541085 [Aspergillus transmontanensis]